MREVVAIALGTGIMAFGFGITLFVYLDRIAKALEALIALAVNGGTVPEPPPVKVLTEAERLDNRPRLHIPDVLRVAKDAD